MDHQDRQELNNELSVICSSIEFSSRNLRGGGGGGPLPGGGGGGGGAIPPGAISKLLNEIDHKYKLKSTYVEVGEVVVACQIHQELFII